jgi:DNA (cytosine-5)-methyltransferase 1
MKKVMGKREYRFIDLFAGCGGLSEGFYRDGYKALLHLEIDEAACKTLRTRMKHYGYSEDDIKEAVMCDDITRDGLLEDMDKRIHEPVDIIIGGPPCQAFSSVGRAQDPNGMSNDPRNYLFENYLQVLNHYKPKMFIFENVKGLLTARPKGVKIFDIIVREMSKTYNIVTDPKTLLLNAADYGVPQIRERVIIIGIRKDIDYLDIKDVYNSIPKTHSDTDENLPNYVTVGEAILDLPKLEPGEGENIQRVKPTNLTNAYLKKISNDSGIVYNHSARQHNEQDRERYRILSEHKNWQLKDLQKVRPDLIHHDPKHFGNRYTVQESDRPGKTVVAHLYKDGNLFIHPDSTQARTFTVREAARIQSFPDDFVFEGSRTDQFKQVGNAVPPLMAETFAKTIREYLDIIEEKETKDNEQDVI